MALIGKTNEERIWNFLTDKGLSVYGAAGLMGNLYAESALNPQNLQNTYEKKLGFTDAEYTAAVDDGSYTGFVHDAAGYGLAQWTYWSRKEKLLNYVKAAGASVGDLEAQLGYLHKELGESYPAILSALKAAQSVREASDIVLTKYERPANQSESVKEKRAGYGQTYYDKYAAPEITQMEENIMGVKIAHASISENGTITGAAGDQTGKEVCVRGWYNRSEGWLLIRCKDPAMRPYIAEAAEAAAKNDHIGYDQYQNQTLYNQVKDKGFDPAKATVDTETDCSRLVRVCCQYACEKVGNGVTIPDFYTATEPNVLKNTGLFEVLTDSKYTKQDDYLLRGDILCTKTKGHTVVVISNGSKAGTEAESGNTNTGAGTAPAAAKLTVDGKWGTGTTKRLQQIFGTPVDGEVSNQVKAYQAKNPGLTSGWEWLDKPNGKGSALIKAMQKWAGMAAADQDGEIGPATIKALQRKLGTAVDGTVSKPSQMVKALQKWANEQ